MLIGRLYHVLILLSFLDVYQTGDGTEVLNGPCQKFFPRLFRGSEREKPLHGSQGTRSHLLKLIIIFILNTCLTDISLKL